MNDWTFDVAVWVCYNYVPEAHVAGFIWWVALKEWWRMTMGRSNNVLKTVALIGAFAAAATLVGCTSSSGSYAKAKEYQSDPSPEVDTLYERDIDISNRISITNDENLRMLNEDLGRFFLLDRQSRLSPKPIPR